MMSLFNYKLRPNEKLNDKGVIVTLDVPKIVVKTPDVTCAKCGRVEEVAYCGLHKQDLCLWCDLPLHVEYKALGKIYP